MGRYKSVRLRDQQGKPFGIVDQQTGKLVSKTKSRAAHQFDGVALTKGMNAARAQMPNSKRQE